MKSSILDVMLVMLVTHPFAGAADNISIEIDPRDSHARILGKIGNKESFIGSLRLTARGGDVATFNFLPSTLCRKSDEPVVPRNHIELAGPPRYRTPAQTFSECEDGGIIPFYAVCIGSVPRRDNGS